MTYTVLLIDDDLKSLKDLERTIRRLENDCIVISSLTSSDFLNALQSEIPDLVICEYVMPECTEDLVLERIRKDYPMCFRVMLTGDASDSVFLNSIKNAHFCMAKPYKADGIKSVLRIVKKIKELELPAAVASQLISQIELPNLTPVTKSLRNKLRESNCDLADIAEIISHDVVLSAKIIQISNSIMLGFQSPTNSLGVAVARIGLNLLEMLVMTLQMERAFCINDIELSKLNYRHFRMGGIGKRISKLYGMNLAEQDLVVSLLVLSGIGSIALFSIFGNGAESLLNLYGIYVECILCFFILTLWGFEERFIEKICEIQVVNYNESDRFSVVISLSRYLSGSFIDDEDVICNMGFIEEVLSC